MAGSEAVGSELGISFESDLLAQNHRQNRFLRHFLSPIRKRKYKSLCARNGNTSHELSQPIELKSQAPLTRRDQRKPTEKNGNRR